MNDFEVFKTMLSNSKIDPDTVTIDEEKCTVVIEAGYSGFTSTITFDTTTKKLLSIEAYE
jgi:hypothetical protein